MDRARKGRKKQKDDREQGEGIRRAGAGTVVVSLCKNMMFLTRQVSPSPLCLLPSCLSLSPPLLSPALSLLQSPFLTKPKFVSPLSLSCCPLSLCLTQRSYSQPASSFEVMQIKLIQHNWSGNILAAQERKY